MDAIPRRIIVTGAPGTGKSSLMAELDRHGVVVEEPARIVLREHREKTGEPTLDHRPELLVDRIVERSIRDFDAATPSGITFFDRGLPDCVAYAIVSGVDPVPVLACAGDRRYSDPVFLCPPWREIYTTDEFRRATFQQIEMFHDTLLEVYEALAYTVVELPRVSLHNRVSEVVATLGLSA